MGSGRGGRSEETWGRDQEHGQEISLGNQSQRYAEDQDFQQRRAGQRFHYRRRARWRKPFTCGWEDCGSSYLLLAWISLFLVTLPTLSYTAALANGFAICLPPWTASIESPCYVFTPSQVPSDSAPHCGVLAAAPATSGAMCANATSFIHFRMAPDQVGLRVHWTSALAKFFTLPYSIQHLQTLPTIHAHRRPRLLVTAPPITCSRSPARPDRTVSSRLPARLRPAVPPACRPNYPSRLAWTRPLPDRSAQRLHTDESCHPVSYSTLHKYPRKNSEKKTPIHRSNNVFQEPGGGIRAQHTWHQLWTRVNPAYVFLVQQPLAPHNHRLLRAGTRAASTRPLTLSHTLQHGRLQRTDGPSPRDCGLRGQSLVPPSPPFTQAATSLATPGRQPTWGSPIPYTPRATALYLIQIRRLESSGTSEDLELIQKLRKEHACKVRRKRNLGNRQRKQFPDLLQAGELHCGRGAPLNEQRNLSQCEVPDTGTPVAQPCRPARTYQSLQVCLPHLSERTVDTRAPEMVHTPEPGSGIGNIKGTSSTAAILPQGTGSLLVHLPLLQRSNADTRASTMDHTPELGSGVGNVTGHRPQAQIPLARMAEASAMSTAHTPEQGSGIRVEDASNLDSCPPWLASDRTDGVRTGGRSSRTPDSRAGLGNAVYLSRPNRTNLGHGSEVSACRTYDYPHFEPRLHIELTPEVDGHPHRDDTPNSRTRFGSREHSPLRDPYPSAAVARRSPNKESIPRQDRLPPDSPVAQDLSPAPPPKRMRSALQRTSVPLTTQRITCSRASDPEVQTRRERLMASRRVASIPLVPAQELTMGTTTLQPSSQPLTSSPTDAAPALNPTCLHA
jgi:hypothetical protein